MERNNYYGCACSLAAQEYRAKAVKYRGDETLRRCYVELAWKNRKQSREYFNAAK